LKTLHFYPAASVVCLLSSFAVAQTTVSYTSPIADYRPYADEKIVSWRAANDKVGQIGGWRAYAKEAQQPENMPTPMQKLPSAPNSSDAMKTDPHAGHKP
jgi:hypothetical protein